MTATQEVTGRRLAPEDFRVVEHDGAAPDDAIRRILDGRLAGVLMRRALDERRRTALLERFWRQTERERREGAAEGSIVGAYHYGHSTEEYLEAVEQTRSTVRVVLGDDSPVDDVVGMVRRAVAPLGQTVRLAAHGPRLAAESRIASWSTPGKFLLEPHEDAAQLTSPDLADLEISRMHDRPVVAVNVYPEVPARGGYVRVWNVDPDDATRRRCGTEHSGYYYPERSLDGYEFVDAAPRSGDVLLLNARLVHAVAGYPDDPGVAARRLSVNFLMGRLDDRTVVYWA